MNKDKIKKQIRELKSKLNDLEKELEKDGNFIPCTKEELFRKATCGVCEDHMIGDYIISYIEINNNLSLFGSRGNCEISVSLIKKNNKLASGGYKKMSEEYKGLWITGENPGIIITDKNVSTIDKEYF